MNEYGLPQLMQSLTRLTGVSGITQVARTARGGHNKKPVDQETFVATSTHLFPLVGKECVA